MESVSGSVMTSLTSGYSYMSPHTHTHTIIPLPLPWRERDYSYSISHHGNTETSNMQPNSPKRTPPPCRFFTSHVTCVLATEGWHRLTFTSSQVTSTSTSTIDTEYTPLPYLTRGLVSSLRLRPKQEGQTTITRYSS
eukprot:scaffold14253_cov143-Isochrysis_galbana.AAC.3